MDKDKYKYRILLVEDNPGDMVLVEEYLDEHILDARIENAQSFRDAKKVLEAQDQVFDVILLDLSLPDRSGEDLVKEILKISGEIPVIILTGYTDMPFSIRSLQMGISDYLVKDSLSPLALYQSILHNIDRKKFILALEHSEKRYNDLFHLSPQPMWVYDVETYKFIDVNEAAVKNYGYSLDEFLGMGIKDIRPKEDLHNLLNHLDDFGREDESYRNRIGKHRFKDGKEIDVEIHSKFLILNNKKTRVVLANDITERTLYINAIENQNEKLKEIAWKQSHIVRAPLARLMGLADLLNDDLNGLSEEQVFFLKEIVNSANELDNIIKEISSEASVVEIGKG